MHHRCQAIWVPLYRVLLLCFGTRNKGTPTVVYITPDLFSLSFMTSSALLKDATQNLRNYVTHIIEQFPRIAASSSRVGSLSSVRGTHQLSCRAPIISPCLESVVRFTRGCGRQRPWAGCWRTGCRKKPGRPKIIRCQNLIFKYDIRTHHGLSCMDYERLTLRTPPPKTFRIFLLEIKLTVLRPTTTTIIVFSSWSEDMENI